MNIAMQQLISDIAKRLAVLEEQVKQGCQCQCKTRPWIPAPEKRGPGRPRKEPVSG